MFYLAQGRRPDAATWLCAMCNSDGTPQDQTHCASCGAAVDDQRFLLSARWGGDLEAFEHFGSLRLEHPGLAAPAQVFRHERALFSAVPYRGEGLMLDEAAPLTNRRLLHTGQRLLGTLAWLRTRGLRPVRVGPANVLVGQDLSLQLFDLDLVSDEGADEELLPSVAALLARYCHPESDSLLRFLQDVQDGIDIDLTSFGRALEARFEELASVRHPPLLASMSDVGLTRQVNQDNWGWSRLSERAALYVVADGMGGHAEGEVASALAVRTLCMVAREAEAASPQGDDAIEELLDASFQVANNTVKEHADASGTDMGTTLVCLLVLDDHTGFLANVGDSRGYLFRDGRLQQVSRDHSLVQKMVERGRITAEEARHHPHSNILLRTVGTERDIEIDLFRIPLQSGDKLLMCTDGLWGEVEDPAIEAILASHSDPRLAARELVRAAHLGGGKDNVTLMIVGIP